MIKYQYHIMLVINQTDVYCVSLGNLELVLGFSVELIFKIVFIQFPNMYLKGEKMFLLVSGRITLHTSL